MSGISKKEPVSVGSVIGAYIRSMSLAPKLNTQRIFAAWDDCSGAGPFTLKKYFREGKLYITLNSSVIRSQLYYQKDLILEKINAALSDDPLFTKDNRNVGFVKEIILK